MDDRQHSAWIGLGSVVAAAGMLLVGVGLTRNSISFAFIVGGVALMLVGFGVFSSLLWGVPVGALHPKPPTYRLPLITQWRRARDERAAANARWEAAFPHDPYQWTTSGGEAGHRFEDGNRTARFTLTGLGDRWARGVTFHLHEGSPPGGRVYGESLPADSPKLVSGIQCGWLLPNKRYTVKWTGDTRYDDWKVIHMYPFTTPKDFGTVPGFVSQVSPAAAVGRGVTVSLSSSDGAEVPRPSRCLVMDPRHFLFWAKDLSLDALPYDASSFDLAFPKDFDGDKLVLPPLSGPYRVEWFRPLSQGMDEPFVAKGFELGEEGDVL